MASNTKNVKLGVCRVYFDGQDLGYTMGGVEVIVATTTHRVEVDQFGKTAISDAILGRDVKVKVPLAESTLQNMVLVMPGSTYVQTGGALATGTWTPTGNPTNGQTVVLNGSTVTFKAAAPNAANNEVLLGATVALTLTALAAFLLASTDINLRLATYSVSATVLTATAFAKGVVGNSYTLAVGTATGAVSAATLTGGTATTQERVDTTDANGTDLLTVAKELRLHPKALVATDRSQDFVVPLAATPGALTFAYKIDAERIFNLEFQGYPDVNNSNRLFQYGDSAAL